MKLYLYIRLSSADDDLKYKSESESIANQRTLLRHFVESRREFQGWDVEEFVDDGYSGTNDDRPAFNRMIEHLKDGDAQLVICKDFSRFFRDYTEIGDYLERIFPFLGVRFISVNDGYDSDDYKGTTAGMEVVMKYIIYSFYSRDLSVKVKTGLEMQMKRGLFVGAVTPYGYMKNPSDKHHMIPDPETAPVVQRIFKLAIDGHKIVAIARELNKANIEIPSQYFRRKNPDSNRYRRTSAQKSWDDTNIRVILKRYEYTGACVYKKKNWRRIDNPKSTTQDRSKWLIIPGCHEALVSVEDFEQAQNIFRKNPKCGYHAEKDYPLRSLIKCGACGRAMFRHDRCNRTFYRCKQASYNDVCPKGELFYEDDLETVVINSLRQMLTILVGKINLIEEASRKTKGTAANLEVSLQAVVKSIKQNNLARVEGYEKYSDGKISRDDFLSLKDQLSGELVKLNEEKEAIERELAAMESADDTELAAFGKEAGQFLKADEITNKMLLFFIESVKVYSGMSIEIKYRFSDEIMKLLAD